MLVIHEYLNIFCWNINQVSDFEKDYKTKKLLIFNLINLKKINHTSDSI